MADEGGKVSLSKKYGPLTGKGWLLTGGGIFAAYFIYNKIKGGGSSANPYNALTSGGTLPSSSPVSTSTQGYSTYSGWASAAVQDLTGGGLSASSAYNALQNWINGVCLDAQQYSSLGGFIASNGIPPGFGTSSPPLTLCPGATSSAPTTTSTAATTATAPTTTSTAATTATSAATPQTAPGIPASLQKSMIANGEHIVSSAFDPVYNDWVYLTNKGGIYNISPSGGQGAGFLGSIFSLPGTAGWFNNGKQQRTASGLTIAPNGGYTITDTAGETYNFTPSSGGANWATGVPT